jgi:hypothetical protein
VNLSVHNIQISACDVQTRQWSKGCIDAVRD